MQSFQVYTISVPRPAGLSLGFGVRNFWDPRFGVSIALRVAGCGSFRNYYKVIKIRYPEFLETPM